MKNKKFSWVALILLLCCVPLLMGAYDDTIQRWYFPMNQLINKADPSIVFTPATSGDTSFWLGVQDDAGGDDDDIFQIGDGASPGTNAFLRIYTDGSVVMPKEHHAFGVESALGYIGVRFTNDFTSNGGGNFVAGLDIDPTMVLATGDTNYAAYVNIAGFGITTQANETVGVVSSLRVADPLITVSSGATVTRASTVYISSAPTEGSTNASLWVDTGNVILGTSSGKVAIGGTDTSNAALTVNGAQNITDGTTTTRITTGSTGGLNVSYIGTTGDQGMIFRTNNTERFRVANDGTVCIGTTAKQPVYTLDVNGDINSRRYYKFEHFDEEVEGTQFESGLRADEWITAGTNYAAAEVTYITSIASGGLQAVTHGGDNDSVTATGIKYWEVASNPRFECRFKVADITNVYIAVGFVEDSFANKDAYDDDCALIIVDSDNTHTLGAASIVFATNDNNGGVVYGDTGSDIVNNTFVKVACDLTDTEQPRVWINDVEVTAANIASNTVLATATYGFYLMVQSLSVAADTATFDCIKGWQDLE